MTRTEKIEAIQLALGIHRDGVAGDETWGAIYERIVGAEPIPTPLPPDAVDERSERNISTLNEKVRPLARQLVREAAAGGITIKIIDGSRTYAQQDALYAQGRTKPGPIVTNARGGYSWHNFALAFDIGVFHGTEYLDDGHEYDAVGAIGERLGLEWGGRWSAIVDKPHFQYNPNGFTLAQLRERVANGLPVV